MIQQLVHEAICFQYDELQLSNLPLGDFSDPKLRDSFELAVEKGVTSLVLRNCGLTSLNGFPKLGKLIRLDLSFNTFAMSELEFLAGLQSLLSLSLEGCQLAGAVELWPLKRLKTLRQVEVYGTKLGQTPDFVDRIHETLPQIALVNNLELAQPNARSLLEELGIQTF